MNLYIDYFKEKYKLDPISVTRLMIFGARDKITRFYEKFRHQLSLDSKLTHIIIVTTLKDSYKLIQTHLYNLDQ